MSNPEPNNPADEKNSPDPQSVEGLFLAALEKSPGTEREAFLTEVCDKNAELRLRLVALLSAYDDAGSFLQRPISGVMETQTDDFSFLEKPDDPSLLGMLGQYEVYELIGRGGMGMVFRARDQKLNRVVAIKVLAPELSAHANARLRFLREAQAAAAISHPHVVTIFAVEDQADAPGHSLPFLVMECIVGQTLQQKLDKRGSLRLKEIIRISQQMADGLAAAHKQGLIHRDIKPANILLENGVERVKISDFGLARAVDDMTITRTGEVSGTPQYMSPEQAGGERVDHRSDLFSLGCVMYAMCTGRSPFRATSFAAAIKRVCQDTPREITEINPEIPSWLSQLVHRLLEKSPDARPDSATIVGEQLEEWLAAIQQGEVPRSVGLMGDSKPQHSGQSVPGNSGYRSESVADDYRSTAPSGSTRVASTSMAAHRSDSSARVDPLGILAAAIVGIVPLATVLSGAIDGDIGLVVFISVPIGVFMLLRSLPRGHWASEGCFLLMCILLGPLGILLYIAHRTEKRDKSSAKAQPPIDTRFGSQTTPHRNQPHELVPNNSRLHATVGGYLLRVGLFAILALIALLIVGPGWTKENSIQWRNFDRQYSDFIGMGNSAVKEFAAEYAVYFVGIGITLCVFGYVLRFVLARGHRTNSLQLWDAVPFVGITLLVVMILTWYELSVSEICVTGLSVGLVLYLAHCFLKQQIRKRTISYALSFAFVVLTLFGGWVGFLYFARPNLVRPAVGLVVRREIEKVYVNGQRTGTIAIRDSVPFTVWLNTSVRSGQEMAIQAITKDGRLFEHKLTARFPQKLTQFTFEKGELSCVMAQFKPGQSVTSVEVLGKESQKLYSAQNVYLFPGAHRFMVRFQYQGRQREVVHSVNLVKNKTLKIDFDEIVRQRTVE